MQQQTQGQEYLNSKPDNHSVNTGCSTYFTKYNPVVLQACIMRRLDLGIQSSAFIYFIFFKKKKL